MMVEPAVDEQNPQEKARTDVGSVFISNYPPYSVWSPEQATRVLDSFREPAPAGTPLGLYLHIPFCRKRCKFCYFKVYTDKNSKEIQTYLDAVQRETAMLGAQPAVAGRDLKFVYFGGGTPSYISARHLRSLVTTLRRHIPWDRVEEVTFECEPGTLTRPKLEAIREIGVTRLSLGVENFDDTILRENGRAHVSTEIYRVTPWIKDLGFDQFNIDLIAGMVGETWENWKVNIEKTIALEPDSVTIYQMELPYNTVYSRGLLEGENVPEFADWRTKRAWHDYAIETLGAAGYDISSGYTMVKRNRDVHFRYRDSLWHGADLLAVGVSSFGHINGLHYQNDPAIQRYNQRVTAGELPVQRAFQTSASDRLIRETILQLKLGNIATAYFRDKFGVDILHRFAEPFQRHQTDGFLEIAQDHVKLTRAGLLRVDALLPAFYEPRYQNARYT